MTLQTWRPLSDIRWFNDRVNRFFRDNYDMDNEKGSINYNWSPATDIYETADDYFFKLEVAGLSKEDIDIEHKGDLLTIKGERKESKEFKKEDYHRVEIISGKFIRSFRLPQDANIQKINASMKDGILELKVPKAEEKKPKSIPIKSE